MSKPRLTLSDLQEIVRQAEIRKGHDSDDVIRKCFILMEEMGEMAKALRVFLNIKVHTTTEKFKLEDEIADVVYVVIAIANRCGIDIETALLAKIAKDDKKIYLKDDENAEEESNKAS
jgi:NTP pyrophosphatase (non-canonical NTP hydrolase)